VETYQPGQQLKVDEFFKEGDLVDVAGTSIGKGFQGAFMSAISERDLQPSPT
jgi:ribosomal protein L3